MGNLGISELLVIFVIVLVFFGPRRMPEIARSLGSAMREFRRSLNQIQREFEEADPRSAFRGDRSILDRMPEPVRPRPPVQPESAAELTREGVVPVGSDPGVAEPPAAPDGPPPGEAPEPRPATDPGSGSD
jgi:sec-independent protein translocase protein TatA